MIGVGDTATYANLNSGGRATFTRMWSTTADTIFLLPNSVLAHVIFSLPRSATCSFPTGSKNSSKLSPHIGFSSSTKRCWSESRTSL